MIQTKPITSSQWQFINAIEGGLERFGVRFDGTTRAEASGFLTKYAPYFRDMKRVNLGLKPYWTNLGNKPSHFTVIPEILKYFEAEMTQKEDDAEYFHYMMEHAGGDGWGSMS